jgi:hypothetical protein
MVRLAAFVLAAMAIVAPVRAASMGCDCPCPIPHCPCCP